MQHHENDLTKNKDQIIRIIRIMGAVLLVFGSVMMFLYNQKIAGTALILVGIIEIILTPRVLEWMIAVRQRELKQRERDHQE